MFDACVFVETTGESGPEDPFPPPPSVFTSSQPRVGGGLRYVRTYVRTCRFAGSFWGLFWNSGTHGYGFWDFCLMKGLLWITICFDDILWMGDFFC